VAVKFEVAVAQPIGAVLQSTTKCFQHTPHMGSRQSAPLEVQQTVAATTEQNQPVAPLHCLPILKCNSLFNCSSISQRGTGSCARTKLNQQPPTSTPAAQLSVRANCSLALSAVAAAAAAAAVELCHEAVAAGLDVSV
jgi:hypothetical protein